jgi:hypothetical protein
MRDLAGRRAAATAAAAGDTSQSQSQTSDSSAGSAAVVSRPRPGTAGVGADGRRVPPPQQGPLSPRRTAELAARGPGSASRGKGASREGSDGAPSMGSSFSDLDGESLFLFLVWGLVLVLEGKKMVVANHVCVCCVDASVTQSALEEALASRMQDGTIGSRMSVIGGTIGQAIRSRYLPKPNRQ